MTANIRKMPFMHIKHGCRTNHSVHICGKRYVDRVENVTKVTVYSNQKTVELLQMGRVLAKEASDHFFYFEVPNHGETKLLAVAGECRDESFIKKLRSLMKRTV